VHRAIEEANDGQTKVHPGSSAMRVWRVGAFGSHGVRGPTCDREPYRRVVGFHGKIDSRGLVELGMVWQPTRIKNLDTDEYEQTLLNDAEHDTYENMLMSMSHDLGHESNKASDQSTPWQAGTSTVLTQNK
jgi:hypothetical protein